MKILEYLIPRREFSVINMFTFENKGQQRTVETSQLWHIPFINYTVNENSMTEQFKIDFFLYLRLIDN